MLLTPLILAAAICIANVHDGDSLRLCDGERVRIAIIDAPEMPGSPKCERGRRGWCDFRLAVQSRDALQGLLASGLSRYAGQVRMLMAAR